MRRDTFLKEVQKLSPATSQIMLTGFADVKMALALVNECNVFRFLVKPCPIEMIREAIDCGIEQYEFTQKEKESMQKSLTGYIQVLTEVIDLLDPLGMGELSRIRELIQSFHRRLKIGNKAELDIAAMLAPLGSVIIPTPVIIKWRSNQTLSEAERTLIERIPEQTSRMLANIPQLAGIATLLRYQSKGCDGSGFPSDDVKGEAIPIGARILRIVRDYVHLEGTGIDPDEALRRMKENEAQYDSNLFRLLFNIIYTDPTRKRKQAAQPPPIQRLALPFSELRLGDVLIAAVETTDKVVLTAPGAIVSDSTLQKLKNYSEFVGLKEPIRVLRKPSTSSPVSPAEVAETAPPELATPLAK